MAKIKVYELAQELDMQSKDLLAVLKDKGIEVKNHMSVLEDGQVSAAREAVKKPAKSEAAVKAEAPTKTEAPKADAAEPVKKKKSIIFVSNPQNSKMPGAQVPKQPVQKPAPKPVPKAAPAPAPAAKPVEAVKPQAEVKPAETPVVKVEAPKAVETPVVKVEEPVAKPVEKEAEAPVVKKEEAPKAAPVQQERKPQADVKPAFEGNRDGNRERRPFDGNNRDNNRGDRKPFDGNRDNSRGNDNRDRKPFDGNRRNDGRPFDGQRRDNNRPDGNNRDNNRGDRKPFDGNRRNDGRPFDNNRNQNGRPGQGGFQNRGMMNKDDMMDKDRDQRGYSKDGGRGGFGNKAGAKGNKAGFIPDGPMMEPEKHRDEEKRRISQEKDKKNKKDLIYEDDGDMKNLKNKPGKFIKPEKKPAQQVEEQIKVITLPEKLTIKELADKMKMQPSVIVKKLFMQGQIVTVNQEISYEDAENIAIEYDIICEQEVKVDVIEELLKEDEELEENMVKRPPVICVMGHVDHGKTSLLDAIRKTNVTDKEAGGITQHIGAYTVNVNGEKITFLDTPGHEAFTAMRMRGANATDIAILVVAADDGVMPQTVEAINHAKAAGIEIIVAVNKIDKPGANIDRVKQELTEYELVAEDWGGSTVFAPVSAKNGDGIEELLEMIVLTAEMLELKANPNRRARGLVIEGELDKGRGPVATILVQKGTLKVGDFISAGAASGKVRAMVDDKGRRIKEADPSTPVEILGLNDVPNAGEIFLAHANDKDAKYYAETFVAQNKEKLLEDTKAKMSLDDLFSKIQAGNLKELNLIIKADVQGSVEAVKQSLMKLSNEEVVVKCIHGGVGAINESDVILASASNAIIIGFNVRPDAMAKTTAEREGVDVRLYKVIYQAIEDIEAAMKGMLDPVFEEKVIGHAEVRQIFKASAIGNIAGSYVLDGTFQRGCKVRITREGEQIYEGELASLKRFKDDVKEVRSGFECGLVFDGFDGMQELDIVEAYIMVEVPR